MSGAIGSRPYIAVEGGVITHNGIPCRVVFQRGLIRVGCTDITPAALQKLAHEYQCAFPPDRHTVVFQHGGVE